MPVSPRIHKPHSFKYACSLDSAAVSCVHGVYILTLNIQCLLAHFPELCTHLSIHRPHIVLLQETWLDSSTESVDVPGYTTISRRDRNVTANRGGILTLARDDFNGLVHINNCPEEERSWHFLRLGIEIVLVANWYRPGASEHDGFAKLYDEVQTYYHEISGIVIAGDLNVHHRRWLHFSNANTQIGTDLKGFCDYFGMWQAVREPTRNEYLLDLALTDVHGSSAITTPKIADHKGVLIKLPFPEVLENFIEREVWILREADWTSLKASLGNFDWHQLGRGTAEDALNLFLEVLWYNLVTYIPRRRIKIPKRSHPWLNEKSKAAILRKNSAEGTERFETERAKCAQTLAEEKAKYVQELKDKLATLPKSSKQWWRINRELLQRRAKLSSIPTLREGDQWLTDAKAKADAFARTFAAKATLPPEAVDTPYFGEPDVEYDGFVTFRSRNCRRFFKTLDEAKATGHDKISALILKRLCDCLAVPFTKVCRRLFKEGCWPSVWKFHLIAPIFKRGAAFKPDNYRGVHLTTILSKVAEKMLGLQLTPFLQK